IMKNLYTLLIAIITTGYAYTQCPTGNVHLSSQAAIDDFVANYSDCSSLPGNLIIGDVVNATDVWNVSQLSFLNTVAGNLTIARTNLTSLFGLHNLNTVDGGITIKDNTDLIQVYSMIKI